MGEYPLSWAACLCNEGIYNLLLLKGADPDAQDSYGNTVLHMVVVADQLGMYGYALRHPLKSANANIRNHRALTCLTLSCELGRDECFKDMLELSATEFWRYSNITCCGYPLGALDSIEPSGQTSKILSTGFYQDFFFRLGFRHHPHPEWHKARTLEHARGRDHCQAA